MKTLKITQKAIKIESIEIQSQLNYSSNKEASQLTQLRTLQSN